MSELGERTVRTRAISPDRVPLRTGKGIQPTGEVERFVLSKIDGRRTIGDLSVLVGLTTIEVTSIVSRLVQLRTVELA